MTNKLPKKCPVCQSKNIKIQENTIDHELFGHEFSNQDFYSKCGDCGESIYLDISDDHYYKAAIKALANVTDDEILEAIKDHSSAREYPSYAILKHIETALIARKNRGKA